MPSKKYTAQKRKEMMEKKKSQNKPGSSKPIYIFLILVIALVIIAFVVYNYLPASDENTENQGNSVPELSPDYVVLKANSGANLVDVLSNDEDSDGDTLEITRTTTPSYGVTEVIDNEIYYTPNTNFSDTDSFSYMVSDGEYEVSSTVNIVVADQYPIATVDTSKGTIMLELYNDKLPNTCENFIKLANDGFYDGLIFHRIDKGFMIQGGLQTPDGTTKTSPYGPIYLETNNEVKHVDGAISMARTTDPNSATSQFFICDGAQPSLDGSYAAFGKTIVGISVVRDIADDPNNGSFEPSPGGGKPYTDIIINSITISNQ